MSARNILTFIIKLTDKCNLDCDYCYEKDKYSKVRNLSVEQAVTIFNKIRYYLRHDTDKKYHINLIWHGGEPLLIKPEDLDEIFRNATKIIAPEAKRFQQNLQTNATLLNNEYIDIFKKNGIQLGISLDFFTGHRHYRGKRTVHADVMKKIALIKKSGLNFGLLSVITRKNVHRAKDIYYKAKRLCDSFSFLPIISPSNGPSACLRPSPKEWGDFLVKIAGLWLKDKDDICITPISNLVSLITYGKRGGNLCHGMPNCASRHLHIKTDGNVTNCDLFKGERYIFGNIYKDSLKKIISSPKRTSLADRPKRIQKLCKGCKWLKLCNGGCPALAETHEDFFNRTFYCESQKMIFEFLRQRSKE